MKILLDNYSPEQARDLQGRFSLGNFREAAPRTSELAKTGFSKKLLGLRLKLGGRVSKLSREHDRISEQLDAHHAQNKGRRSVDGAMKAWEIGRTKRVLEIKLDRASTRYNKLQDYIEARLGRIASAANDDAQGGILMGVDPRARDRIERKVPVLSELKSAQWLKMPLALRERAQFSAGVINARVMAGVQSRLLQIVREERENLANGKTAVLDRRNFVSQIRDIGLQEGLTPADPLLRGGLRDITSIPRLAMIYDIQTQQAEGYARWKADQDPDALDEFPAQELVRIEDRMVPRDWAARWQDAGGQFFDGGRMIALKSDAIWETISAFGTPYPPFDFNSGMGLVDVDRTEAESLGLLKPGELVQPRTAGFNDELSLSISDMLKDPAAGQAWEEKLREDFGDQITIDGGRVKWTAAHDDPFLVGDYRLGKGGHDRQIKEAATAISDLHSIDDKGLLPVLSGVTKPNYLGEYMADYSSKNAFVRMNPGDLSGQGFHYTHEFGHHIDNLLGGIGKYSSQEKLSEVKPVLDAIRITQTHQDYLKAAQSGDSYAAYLVSSQEMFARAYAQWVSEKSGLPQLVKELDEVRSTWSHSGGYWTKDEFKKIGSAMESLLKKKGWL